MQQFPCPFCGPRPEDEFRYAGDAGRPRPGRNASDAEWTAYLHFGRNARGAAQELWIHSYGCGRWIELSRDTVSHVVDGAKPMNP